MNTVAISGRLGQDVQTKRTTNGGVMLTNSIAVDLRTKNGKITEWHNVVAYGKTAELIERYFHKGSMIGIEGSLRSRVYKDKDGNNRHTDEIQIEKVTFMDSGNEPSIEKETEKSDPFKSGDFENFEPLNEGDLPF